MKTAWPLALFVLFACGDPFAPGSGAVFVDDSFDAPGAWELQSDPSGGCDTGDNCGTNRSVIANGRLQLQVDGSGCESVSTSLALDPSLFEGDAQRLSIALEDVNGGGESWIFGLELRYAGLRSHLAFRGNADNIQDHTVEVVVDADSLVFDSSGPWHFTHNSAGFPSSTITIRYSNCDDLMTSGGASVGSLYAEVW